MKKVIIAGSLFFCGCNYYMPHPCTPPPPSARPPTTLAYWCTEPTVPPVIPNCDEPLALADLVDVALRNSPKTRASWYAAQQAATDVGVARGAYLPSVDLQGFWVNEAFPEPAFNLPFIFRETILGATLSTTYLLFDFGGRNGNLMAALAALANLTWSHHWEVQTVMSHAIQSYYNYIYALALVNADLATVNDNWITVEAAATRRAAGAASIADELQARTNAIQSEITLEQDRGNLNVALVTLVQALGLPLDTPISVSELPETIDPDGPCFDMCAVLKAAKEKRADLKAQRATVLQRRFQIRSAKSALLPNINTQVLGGKESIDNSPFINAYQLQFNLNVPLFHSFADINALRKAQAALLQAQANLDDDELAAFLSVLSDYYELIANQKILKYSYTYLEVAQENQQSAFANYRAGVTTIIDLMTANNFLNQARTQLINAKLNFLTSLANLSYHTGTIEVDTMCPENPCLEVPDA